MKRIEDMTAEERQTLLIGQEYSEALTDPYDWDGWYPVVSGGKVIDLFECSWPGRSPYQGKPIVDDNYIDADAADTETPDYDFDWDGSTGGNLSPTDVIEDCLRNGETHEEWADKFTSEGFVQHDVRDHLARDASEEDREFNEADWAEYVDQLREFIIETLDAATPQGTICRRVEVSAQAFEFSPDSELESWEAVVAGADLVELVTGIMGRSPYAALYRTVTGGRAASYLVAEPVYGITDFAAVLGLKTNHFRSLFSRGQGGIPRPALEVGGHPIWTHAQVETCKRVRLLKTRQPRPVVVITENDSADPEAKRYLVSHHQGAMPAHAEHGFDSLVQAKGSVGREYLLRRPVRRDEAAGDVLFIGRLRAKRPKS